MTVRIALLILIPFLANGCTGSNKIPVKAKVVSGVTPALVLKQLKTRGNFIKTLSSLNKMTIQSPTDSKSFTQIILLDSVNKIRLESLNPFGQPSLFIIKNNNRELLHNVMENSYLTWESEKSLTLAPLGINIKLKQIGLLLTQNFFQESDIEILDYTEHLEKGFSSLLVSAQEKKMEIRLNKENLPLFFRQYNAFGAPEFEVKYNRYDLIDGFSTPHRIEIFIPVSKITIILKVYDVTINGKIDSNNFVLRIPKGAKKIE